MFFRPAVYAVIRFFQVEFFSAYTVPGVSERPFDIANFRRKKTGNATNAISGNLPDINGINRAISDFKESLGESKIYCIGNMNKPPYEQLRRLLAQAGFSVANKNISRKNDETSEMNAAAIKDFRKRHHITQAKLADILGVSPRTIQNYEDGRIIPRSKSRLLKKIFEAYEANAGKQPTEDRLIKYMDFYDSYPIFTNIDPEEIVRYVIVHDEELMKNEVFRLYVKNKQSEKTIEILLEELEKTQGKKQT